MTTFIFLYIGTLFLICAMLNNPSKRTHLAADTIYDPKTCTEEVDSFRNYYLFSVYRHAYTKTYKTLPSSSFDRVSVGFLDMVFVNDK